MPQPGSAPCWAAAAGRWGCRLLALLLLLLSLSSPGPAGASEITFELPDNAKQCFYEDIAQGTKCTLEFQVLRARRGPGGSLRYPLRGASVGRLCG
jgi:protein ERP2